MLSFSNFLTEGIKHKLFAFDMDETLFAHDPKKLKIHVRDQHGKKVKSLTNQEFNKHKLQSGHHYDFSEFRSAKTFGRSAHPIHKMIHKASSLQKRGHKVEILTARADLDDKHAFAHHLKKHGIDAGKIHVRRAGNIEGSSTGDRKRRVLADQIRKHNYKEVHLYDDDEGNHHHFSKLKHEFPHVRLVSHIVKHNDKTGETKIHTVRH